MNGGRPRTLIGSYGAISVSRRGTSYVALARIRDADRAGFGAGGLLDLSSSFRDLADLWLEDLELRELSDGTKKNYRDDLRLRVRPQFEHFSLGEITTGRVEWFLRSESAASFSRAHHSRTVLYQLFAFTPARRDSAESSAGHGSATAAAGRAAGAERRADQRNPRRRQSLADRSRCQRVPSPTVRCATSSKCSSERRSASVSASRSVCAMSTTVPAG
ncbi:hypothetical protein [Microbacterium psychrotolerans]|uniref:hypothetical protein n=1 Tax=Microbacterium psychrotolerans TaxID=3068321 RepID=UPI003AAFD1F5